MLCANNILDFFCVGKVEQWREGLTAAGFDGATLQSEVRFQYCDKTSTLALLFFTLLFDVNRSLRIRWH